MKDYLGQDLKVGDKIVYLSHTRTSSDLSTGRIAGFTPCYVKLESTSPWAKGKVSPEKVIKVPEALQ
ncbi:hypothetical protein [Metapseudomonas otitidis]|uniref:hypothetical protein n=1 Tax=Metapseudomonas otitidis TaxID=319939 RepID=UPI0013F65DE3|nr:hypothetical protein [Pseudomonas otitidis]